MVGSGGPNQFIDQFLGPRATALQTLETAADLLIYGLGAWTLFACLAPRAAILALPWIWSLCNGRWSLRFLAAEEWHHVRYTVLPVVMMLAAGVIGYARLGSWLRPRRGGWSLLVVVWLLAALAGGLGLSNLSARMARIPGRSAARKRPTSGTGSVGSGPRTAYSHLTGDCCQLASRKRLFSNVLEQNKPRGYPQLGPEFQWIFLRNRPSASRFFGTRASRSSTRELS